jgi:hypothetical protein
LKNNSSIQNIKSGKNDAASKITGEDKTGNSGLNNSSRNSSGGTQNYVSGDSTRSSSSHTFHSNSSGKNS